MEVLHVVYLIGFVVEDWLKTLVKLVSLTMQEGLIGKQMNLSNFA